MNSSIFNFNNGRTLRHLFSPRALLFAVGCIAIAGFLLLGIDQVDIPYWLIPLAATSLALAAALPEYRRHLMLLLISLVLFFVVAEVFFRVHYIGPQALNVHRYRPASHLHPWSLFEYSPDTYTGAKPGVILFKGHPYRVNQDGFRGANFPLEKAPDTLRIALSGPSVAMGSGVREEDMFTTHLTRMLNETYRSAGLRVEIIHLAAGGSVAGHMLHAIQHVGMRYDPDIIMLCMNPTRLKANDLIWQARAMQPIRESTWGLIVKKRYSFFNSRLYVMPLVREWQRKLGEHLPGWRRTMQESVDEDQEYDDIRHPDVIEQNAIQVLNDLRGLADDYNTTPIVYLFKPVRHLHDPAHDQPYRSQLKYHAAQRNISIADSYEADYAGYEEADLYVYPGDRHPNATMHRLYADRFYETLKTAIDHIVIEKKRGSS